MRVHHRRYFRISALAIFLLLLAAWLVPSFFSAERYRHRLEAGLARALQRPVAFGAVTYRLLPRPGFSIENAMVNEDPAFGSEPFARVEHIDCDLRWRSLFHSRLDCGRLHLDRPSLNFVKNSRGEWNVESLLRTTGLTAPAESAERGSGVSSSAANLDLDADGARIDFKVGVDKKPFALTELQARINFDRRRGLLSFRLTGTPVRTDLSVSSPAPVRLEGQWTPGAGLEGPLEATIQTRAAMVYDWIPLVSGRHPEVYGVMDAQARVTGSLHLPTFEGQAVARQLHRWGQLPPSDPMPTTFVFRGQFDRSRGRVLIESLDTSFADSHIHLTGSIDKVPTSPELDLVVAVARSRLEDFLNLSHRFFAPASTLGISGRVDALLSIQGPWRSRRYRGYVGARDVTLTSAVGSFKVSDVDVRVAENSAHLAPVRVALSPHVGVLVEGAIEPASSNASPRRRAKARVRGRQESAPRYELLMTAQAAPLRDLLGFGRAIGLLSAQGVDARGTASAAFSLSGPVWPISRPSIKGHAEFHAARLLVPGFTEPINLPRALIQVSDDHVTAYPVVAVLGTSVFTGRLEHQGERQQSWEFDIHANTLSLEQGSLWFEALGHRPPVPLLARLPGLSSFGAVRAAASSLFGAMSARGRFSSPFVTYRGVSLADLRAAVEISGRVVRLEEVTFRAGGGRGRGQAVIDLSNSPARVAMDVTMADCSLQALAAHSPAVFRKVRGSYSGTGHFETRGLSHEEMTTNLQGKATARVKNAYLGDFDPLQALAGQAGWGPLEPAHRETSIRSAVVSVQVQDRRVEFRNTAVQLSGASLRLSGAYGFDGGLDLAVFADMSHLTRRVLNADAASDSSPRHLDIRLAGSLDKLTIQPKIAASQPNPFRRGR